MCVCVCVCVCVYCDKWDSWHFVSKVVKLLFANKTSGRPLDLTSWSLLTFVIVVQKVEVNRNRRKTWSNVPRKFPAVGFCRTFYTKVVVSESLFSLVRLILCLERLDISTLRLKRFEVGIDSRLVSFDYRFHFRQNG